MTTTANATEFRQAAYCRLNSVVDIASFSPLSLKPRNGSTGFSRNDLICRRKRSDHNSAGDTRRVATLVPSNTGSFPKLTGCGTICEGNQLTTLPVLTPS